MSKTIVKKDAVTVEVCEYGDILNETICKVFGDELTFNELKDKNKEEYDYTNLKTEQIRWDWSDQFLFRVYFDSKVVLERKYSYNYSCIMFYCLSELFDYLDVNEGKCCGCGSDKIEYTECGGRKGVNMCEECWT